MRFMIEDEVELIKKELDEEDLKEMTEEYGENFERFIGLFDDTELTEYADDQIEITE